MRDERPRRRLALVEWDDAHFDSHPKEVGPCRTFTVGYLKRRKTTLQVWQSWSALEGYAECVTIPLGMVHRVLALDSGVVLDHA